MEFLGVQIVVYLLGFFGLGFDFREKLLGFGKALKIAFQVE